MFAVLAAFSFTLGAIFQAISGPNLDTAGAWPFWLLTGLALTALHAAPIPTLNRRG